MTTRVLVVEGDRAGARVLDEILAKVPERPFASTTVETLADAQAHVAGCDVILLDLSADAFQSAAIERMVALARSKPIVVLARDDDEDAVKKALQLGAQDVLSKTEMSAALVARSIKYAIERKRAESAELARTKSEDAAAHARFVADALREITRALDLQGTLGALAKVLVPRLGDLCVVDLLRENGRIVPVAYAGATLPSSEAIPCSDEGAVALAIERRVPIRFSASDTEMLDERHRMFVERMGARSISITPLIARDCVIGTISTAYCRADGAYGPDEVLLIDEVASHAALAIDNARLYDRARRAVQARDELLTIVSHDLRNPMNVMTLALQLVSNGTAAQRELNIGRIRRAVERMQGLIEDLLDVARVDSGTLEINASPADLSTVLDDTIELFTPLAAEKKIMLVADYHAGALGFARIDAQRVAQVLSNLLGNALKFTPPGGTIQLGARPFGADKIRIDVRDSGPGIGAEHIEHVFDRFWQREPRNGGVGLGLAIAKGIVEGHGGSIHVESTPGMGACFWFTVERCAGEHAGTKLAL